MNNEKGEVTVLTTMLIAVLTGIVLLCALELQKSFSLLNRRTHLFLCVKETKGELNDFMKFMGRTNWAIKNINKASLVMMFIPGLQGIAADAQKAKKYLQYVQEGRTVLYMKTLADLRGRKCSTDPRMFITPFKIGSRLLKRDAHGAAELREEKWTYYYLSRPYLLQIEINASGFESLKPKIVYKSEEKAAKLSSLLSSR
jgi:hypothetical protein